MADIQKELRVIRAGRWGIEFRQAVHDALQKIHESIRAKQNGA